MDVVLISIWMEWKLACGIFQFNSSVELATGHCQLVPFMMDATKAFRGSPAS